METNGQFASAEQLVRAAGKGRRHKTLTLPVCKLRVRIRSLTEREVSQYQMEAMARNRAGFLKSRLEDANRRLLVLCLVDGAGNRLFTDEDATKLADWDAADTQYLYEECARHCGINREDLEELVKNSPPTIADGSPTASPGSADG